VCVQCYGERCILILYSLECDQNEAVSRNTTCVNVSFLVTEIQGVLAVQASAYISDFLT